MKQLTINKQIRIDEDMRHYFDVLSKKYKINTSQFIRMAVIEKLKRDMPKIREIPKRITCPF